jgi:ubiquinone/menaquinone biosynthesis C-methylase UbiE
MVEQIPASVVTAAEPAEGRELDRRERYSHGYSDRMLRIQGQRTAAKDAGFLLPYLRPSMRLLDFGCGGGSITLGLAEFVAPGEVVGLDIEPSALERARTLAADRGIANVRFEQGSVYDLPFAAGTFDAAFSRSVLEHLAQPVEALCEVRRVLKPGGVIGVADGDWGSRVVAPPSPLVEETYALYARVWERNGGNPRRGRELKALLREAGFQHLAAFATAAGVEGTADAARAFADLVDQLFRRPSFVNQVIQLGWATQQRLDELVTAFHAWAEHPDAFSAVLLCQAVGWVPETRDA